MTQEAGAPEPMVAPFPTHAGLDEFDPWVPTPARGGVLSFWPWGMAQLSETLEVVALAILMFLAVRAVGQNFIVDGDSMRPTFHDNELVIVNRLAYIEVDLSWLPWMDEEPWSPFGDPQVGDVVVFEFPGDPGRDFIKRVIAREGQTVSIRNGVVFVDGAPLDEPYVPKPCEETGFVQPCGDAWDGDFPEQTVPEGMLFVLGDNRGNSFDSRSWGMLDERAVVGRADLRYWPFDSIGMVDHHRPDQAVTVQLSASP